MEIQNISFLLIGNFKFYCSCSKTPLVTAESLVFFPVGMEVQSSFPMGMKFQGIFSHRGHIFGRLSMDKKSH